MENRRRRLILLHLCPQVTRPLLKKLMKMDPSLLYPFSCTPLDFSTQLSIPFSRAQAVIKHVNNHNIMKKLDIYEQYFTILTCFDNQYPPQLRLIPDPPYVLYVQGDPTLFTSPLSISVIGTRNPSSYALPTMKKVLLPLIHSGFTIVSGMALGIDQFAHSLALENKGKTIAVLGSGFQHIYPKNNLYLYKKMVENHTVISEYPPDVPARRYQFPERNRLISGLTPSTFVIEARLKSGTLITVDQALEQGKDVYALPGPAGSATSEGCHKMINDGAKLVHTYQDILEDWLE
ncbi:DNA-processing protein DprA [Halobacillus karajensis]|uniref:DNA protecting protein DprA n=2 Tax=Halobacillus karajensis TaxID=195088 RepID=A0A024P1N6_9BACI|nr:DNA-processing protein DprA [Halobacillus karajensis]CDQ19754.1 DNA protecting protein DprA [Halobacillus karajensis]CDQ22214.1 DNA protecting protein DprA [Halobacillus karajensis]CDQ28055.1 DNA protecting protein DprA [Halobacillus karajensis]